MRRKVLAKLLSLSLAVVMTFGSLSVPSYAMETGDLTQVTAEAEGASFDEEAEDVLVVDDETDAGKEALAEGETAAEDVTGGDVVVTTDENADENTEADENAEADETTDETADADEPAEEDIYSREGEFEEPEDAAPADEVVVQDDTADLDAEVTDADKASDADAAKAADADALAAKDADVDQLEDATGKFNLVFRRNLPAGIKDEECYGYSDGRSVLVGVGEPIALSGSEITIYGYDITGWTYKIGSGKEVKLKGGAVVLDSIAAKEGETVEIKPTWKQNTYTITYDFNGGKATGKISNKVTYKYDSTTRYSVPLLNYEKTGEHEFAIKTTNLEVTKPNCTFQGWYDTNSSTYYTSYGGASFQNLNLRASWSYNSLVFTMDCNGGAFYNDSTEAYDIYERVFNTTYGGAYWNWVPYRDGYTFKGWEGTLANGKTKFYKPSDKILLDGLKVVDGKTSVKAVWAANSYKITYELNGGKINKAPKTYKVGVETAIPTPTMDGYKFMGWTVTQGDEIFDEALTEDGKISEATTGDLELRAIWTYVRYNFVFKSSDGKETYSEGELYNGLGYFANIDFIDAALMIENSESFDKTKSIVGFATTPNAKKANYQLNKQYTKFGPKTTDSAEAVATVTLYTVTQDKVFRVIYQADGGVVEKGPFSFTAKQAAKNIAVKAVAKRNGYTFKGWEVVSGNAEKDAKGNVVIKAGAAEDVVLKAVYSEVFKYTVTLMPNAKDEVKDGDGKVVFATGVQFKSGEQTEFAYDDYNTGYLPFDWTRKGYYFDGFATDPKGKNRVGGTYRLGNGKSTDVKLYAVWVAKEIWVAYSYQADILRDGKEYSEYQQSFMGAKFGGYDMFTYGKKAVTPKKLSVPGFTFKGWKVEENTDPELASITYTDASKTFVKTINKDNASYITLKPVFEEISYKLYVNTNGGSYKDQTSNKAVVSEKVFYTDSLNEIINDLFSSPKKAGCRVQTVSTTKDTKGYMRQSVYNGGNYTYYYYHNYRLASKQDAAVVLNIIWYTVTPADNQVRINHVGLSYDPETEKDCIFISFYNYTSSGYSQYVVEYSTSPKFDKDVQTYTHVDGYDAMIPITLGKNYFVRIKYGISDSTGGYSYSNWTRTYMIPANY